MDQRKIPDEDVFLNAIKMNREYGKKWADGNCSVDTDKSISLLAEFQHLFSNKVEDKTADKVSDRACVGIRNSRMMKIRLQGRNRPDSCW